MTKKNKFQNKMKFYSQLTGRFQDVDESLIIRGHMKVPDQSEPVPIHSEEPDIIDSFTEAIMKEKDISDETKAQIERRCGKERRREVYEEYFLNDRGYGDWHEHKEQRRQHDRRGRKSAKELAEFMDKVFSLKDWLPNESIHEYRNRVRVPHAEAILKFLNY